MIKQPYLLITYNTYYPGGGFSDLEGRYDSLPDALDAFSSSSYDVKELHEILEDGTIIEIMSN